MGWTKRQLVDEAYSELAMAGFVFDLTPEERQSALRRMEAFMATWNGRGINTGYVVETDPEESDLDDDSGIYYWAAEAIYMHLAVRLAAQYGKSLPQGTLAIARDAYSSAVTRGMTMVEYGMPATMPYGAGNRNGDRARVFFRDSSTGTDDSFLILDDGSDLELV